MRMSRMRLLWEVKKKIGRTECPLAIRGFSLTNFVVGRPSQN